MGATRPFKVGVDGTLGLIAKRLRDEGATVPHEALPARWVDLILYLDRQERGIEEHGKLQDHANDETR